MEPRIPPDCWVLARDGANAVVLRNAAQHKG